MAQSVAPMSDPRPADASAPTGEPPPPDSVELVIPKRRLWPVFAVIGLVLAAAGIFAYRALTATDPLRILVAIDLGGHWWEGSEPAAKLADELGAQLAELGFDPVKGGDPGVMKALESAKDPRAAAKKLGAGFIIEARLAPEIVEHPVKDGYFEIRADAPVTLTFLDRGTSTEARLRGYSGARTKERALMLLADSMASRALDAVIAQLVDHPAVREITEGSNVKLLERLQPARTFAQNRTIKLAEVADAYGRADGERGKEGAGRVTYLSHASAEDLLVGVSGAGYFVKTADVTPYYSSHSRDIVRTDALETVEWRPLDGKALPTTDPAAPPPMWKGYHVYTYPSARPDGDQVAFVEDIFGWAKTITVVDRSGKGRRVRVDPEHRFVDPRIAPGGRYVAVYDRPAPGAPADLMVVETEGGKEVFGFHTENQSLGGFLWIDDHRLAFAYVPEDAADSSRRLAVVDVSKQPLSIDRPFRARPGEDIVNPAASPDGKRIACYLRGPEPGIAVIDTDTWSRKVYSIEQGASASWPVFSPDGALVAFELRGPLGADIAVLDLATGSVTRVTASAIDEGNPRFSADGAQLLFEVRYRDPAFPRRRWLSRIASAKVPR